MNLPPSLKSLLMTLYGFKLVSERYSGCYRSFFKHYSQQRYQDREKEDALQFGKFIQFIKYAKAHSEFYRELYKGIDLDSFTCLDDIKLLPVVTKEELRKNINAAYTISERRGIPSFTGGTTGTSLQVYFTKNDFRERMAYLDAFKAKLGVNGFDRKATFSGREIISKRDAKNGIFWINNYAYRQRMYSTFHLTGSEIPNYISDLNDFKPTVINGFVSAIYQLAKHIVDNSSHMSFTPKAIFTTSESLLPHHRKTIEQAFGAKVYNQYASAEGAPFITECMSGKLHYNIDTGIIEIQNDNSILVTSFTTHGTPLIRYAIGDLIILSDDQTTCACGSTHPIVDDIGGRAVDYLYSPSGNKVSLSHLADVIKGIPSSVKNVQFIQKKIDEIEIMISVDESLYSYKDNDQILESMQIRFGEDLKLSIIKVDSISLESSGKYSLIKNNLKIDA
jgi:phenylacetate-CoA ligase